MTTEHGSGPVDAAGGAGMPGATLAGDPVISAAPPEKPSRFPHTLTLILACIVVAAVLTWVLPAGEFERRDDAATGRSVVVPGSYHAVERTPVGPWEMLLSIPKGIIAGADIIMLVFLMGGAFTVIDRAGALRGGFEALVGWLGTREALVIPISILFFATGGVLFNMQEEIIAIIPVLVLVLARLGFDPMIAVAMSIGAASIGASFSPMNPFQVVIAQKLAELPLLSGAAYRVAFLIVALLVYGALVMRYALRTRTARAVAPALGASGVVRDAADSAGRTPARTRDIVIMLLVLVTFGIYVYGAMQLDWGFNELAAVFFLLGIVAGLVGGLRMDGTARAYVEGFREMAFAALIIGIVRAIYVVLSEGHVIDTIVYGLFQPLGNIPGAASAVAMMGVQTLIHVPVSSVSGQAVLTMPILVPLTDLLGVSRQVTVLAYQYGAGLCELLTPTNGALMAVLASAGVRYDRWIRFIAPLWAAVFVVGVVSVLVAVAVGL
jgi:uncharacterized ion transporter superfamily protein YfcC